MSESLETVCKRHTIAIADGRLKVETHLPGRHGTLSTRRRPWTRNPIPLPEGVTEDNVELVYASARRGGIDVIVDLRVYGKPRAWLWRLSPVRIRAVDEITYPSADGYRTGVWSHFRAKPLTQQSGVLESIAPVRLMIDNVLGTTLAELGRTPARPADATLVGEDPELDLFISYKAQDLDSTQVEDIVAIAHKRDLKVWYAPERLQGQPDFRMPINQAIAGSMRFLIIWSDHSADPGPRPNTSATDPPSDSGTGSELTGPPLPSHMSGVQKMNQLWEVKYILEHASSDLEKRVWVFDARSAARREVPGSEAIKAALEQIAFQGNRALHGLHVDPSGSYQPIMKTIIDTILKSRSTRSIAPHDRGSYVQ